ncbi:hypothetical protein [Klebsiella quasipneumoniae]|uniref:hypothetical protein n=1 Tax=Klebsiella quasipneumoniae TaxID=1463165 RepID=UPI000C7D60A0|nr:hypothetical protein [Klebsiella quasipneumoniae]PLJ40687.1 hypothetical protein B6J67_18545 [Klebsiella quasipneumoniae]PLJ61432.1 hypothetical protein B6J68_16160 [Klebsiella quasipneumoniae]
MYEYTILSDGLVYCDYLTDEGLTFQEVVNLADYESKAKAKAAARAKAEELANNFSGGIL